jgi:hypothetical protein
LVSVEPKFLDCKDFEYIALMIHADAENQELWSALNKSEELITQHMGADVEKLLRPGECVLKNDEAIGQSARRA